MKWIVFGLLTICAFSSFGKNELESNDEFKKKVEQWRREQKQKIQYYSKTDAKRNKKTKYGYRRTGSNTVYSVTIKEIDKSVKDPLESQCKKVYKNIHIITEPMYWYYIKCWTFKLYKKIDSNMGFFTVCYKAAGRNASDGQEDNHIIIKMKLDDFVDGDTIQLKDNEILFSIGIMKDNFGNTYRMFTFNRDEAFEYLKKIKK